MNVKTYLVAAIIGGILVVVFSPSLFFLVVEGDLPKIPLERKVYEPQSYTIIAKKITITNGERLKNENLSVKTVGNNYTLHGEVLASSPITFLLFDDTEEFQKFLNGSSYNAIFRYGLKSNVKQSFHKDLESGKSFDLELVFINSEGKDCNVDVTLSASYSVEDVDIDYIPDLIRGILFPSLCVLGLVILLVSFMKLRGAMKASYSQERVTSY